jgi:hypothetical protein
MNDGDDGRNGTIRRIQGIFQFDSDATEAEVEAHVFDDLIEQGVSVEQAADAADFIAASAIKARDARAERAVVLERRALAEQMQARKNLRRQRWLKILWVVIGVASFDLLLMLLAMWS